MQKYSFSIKYLSYLKRKDLIFIIKFHEFVSSHYLCILTKYCTIVSET